MKADLIGLPHVGKRTIFNLLCRIPAASRDAHESIRDGVVTVPDERIDRLVEIYQSKKIVHAQIVFRLLPGLTDVAAGAQHSADHAVKQAQVFASIAETDLIVHVVRSFRDESVFHILESVDEARDIQLIESEMMLSDLLKIENRLERLAKSKKSMHDQQEEDLLKKFKAALEEETPLRELEISENEEKLCRNFQFMSLKPLLILLNLDESDFPPESGRIASLIEQYSRKHRAVCTISAKIESELAEMPADEAEMFLEEMGVTERALNRFIRSVYELMGLETFFSAADKESHAWTIAKGATALEAAGEIHSDIQRGFIRAEVLPYDKLVEAGNEKAAREKNFIRLEGKQYIVQDGDIIFFRFNV